MTLVSSIIQDAYRETNLIPMGVSPSTNQTTEGLNRLNSLILSTVGFEAGDDLNDLSYGGDYDQSAHINDWIPDNTRLVFNLSGAVTLYVDPDPYDGQRLAFLDAAGNLATYNVTLDGNGRNIEGTATLTLSTDSDSRQWMYRADTGNWIKVETLESTDEMPFPSEFDDYFVLQLAMRLNPRYGQSMAPESVDRMRTMRAKLRSRYRRRRLDVQTDPGLVKRDVTYGDESFDTGRYWPWQT